MTQDDDMDKDIEEVFEPVRDRVHQAVDEVMMELSQKRDFDQGDAVIVAQAMLNETASLLNHAFKFGDQGQDLYEAFQEVVRTKLMEHEARITDLN